MERLTRRCVDGQAWVSMAQVAASGEYECVGPAIDRLAAYEDTGLTPEEIERILDAYGRGMTLRSENAERLRLIKDISTNRLRELARAEAEEEKNEPLTVAELREMTCQPVCIVRLQDNSSWWSIIRIVCNGRLITSCDGWFLMEEYGETWLAYRRKPKEVVGNG